MMSQYLTPEDLIIDMRRNLSWAVKELEALRGLLSLEQSQDIEKSLKIIKDKYLIANLKTFEVWAEGYSATGDNQGASFHGNWQAETFKEACAKWAEGVMEGYYNAENNTFWGCRLFDNEEDARRSFG